MTGVSAGRCGECSGDATVEHCAHLTIACEWIRCLTCHYTTRKRDGKACDMRTKS